MQQKPGAETRTKTNEPFTQSRRAWADNAGQKAVLHISKGGKDSVVLHLSRSRSYVNVDLTYFTADELFAFKSLVDIAIAEALPRARDRDRIAAEALEHGITSFGRCFRPDPTLWVREGEGFEDFGGPTLRKGLEDGAFDSENFGLHVIGKKTLDLPGNLQVADEDDAKTYGMD